MCDTCTYDVRPRIVLSLSSTKSKDKCKMPESGIPPSYRATRRYTKVHLGFCLRFSTLIGQIGRVPLFGAGPRQYIRSRLFRLAVIAFWRALAASCRQKGKRKQIFPRAIRTTELPPNPSPLTFRNNQIQNLTDLFDTRNHGNQRKLPTHTARGCHTDARTYNARQRDKSPDSPATPCRTGGEINVVLQQQRMVRV